MMKFLSHGIEDLVPSYGVGVERIELRPTKAQARGDSCQVFWFGMHNHVGTHVDCPAHFFSDGRKIVDYEADFWLFYRPQALEVEVRPGQILRPEELTGTIDRKSDLLLLRSGWGRFRGQEVYSLHGPGLAPEMGVWLRKEFPLVRAIGFDWISLSSFEHRESGREAHRTFLNPDGEGHPIVIIEDMDLSPDLSGLKEVIVAPLRMSALDSSPCTVIGIFE